jgi:hypothetical protein
VSTVFLLPDDPAFSAIGFDNTTSENHEETSQTTDNPVETGVIVSDHLVHEPQKFGCVVVVSQSPLGPNFFGEGGEPTTVNGVFGEGVTRQGADFVKEMKDRLTALRLSGTTMTILTSAGEYDKMQLLSVGLPREESSLGAGKFTLSFKRLFIVQTQNVNAPQPKEPRGAATVAKGAQTPSDAPNPVKDMLSGDKSILKAGLDKYGPSVSAFLGL